MFGFGDPNIYQPRAPANPRLLKALATAATSDDAAVRHGLFDALMNSVLLIPTRSAPAADVASMPAIKNFLLVEDDRGQPSVCVFTDLAAMHRWQPENGNFLIVPMPQLLRESFPTCAAGIWINIGDRAARFVSRAELSQVTGGLVCPTYATQVEKELAPLYTDFAPRLPASLPTGLVARLAEVLRPELDVVQAYVMEVDPNPRRRRLCVGLRFARLLDEAQLDALSRRVARAVNDAKLHRRGTIDVIVLDFKKHRAAAAVMPPIFER